MALPVCTTLAQLLTRSTTLALSTTMDVAAYGAQAFMEQHGCASDSTFAKRPCPSQITPHEVAVCAQAFMEQHGFASVEDFRGASLPYFTTHHELVRLQREAIDAKKRARTGLAGDADWSGDGFVRCAAFPMLGCRVWREEEHGHWPGWLR